MATVYYAYVGLIHHDRTHISSSGVSTKEVETERVAKAVVQDFEHFSLHGTDSLTAVGVVSDEDKVIHLWSVHLLVLASYQHGCHSY